MIIAAYILSVKSFTLSNIKKSAGIIRRLKPL